MNRTFRPSFSGPKGEGSDRGLAGVVRDDPETRTSVKRKTAQVAWNGKTFISGATIPNRGRLALHHHGSKNKAGVWVGPPSPVPFKNLSIKDLK